MADDWKPVPGSLGYEVSDAGQVRRGGRLLKPYPQRGDYLLIGIDYPAGRQRKLVHRLVLEAFVGPCPEGQEACHGTPDRSDNRLSNLRYDTRLANMRDQYAHGTRVRGAKVWNSRLSAESAGEIRRRVAAGSGHRELAREYGVSHSSIGQIVRGESWSANNG